LGYSTNSRAYRVFNKIKKIETVMESINVVIDDEEIEAPSKREENQLNSAELPFTPPGMSPAESLPTTTTSDTTASASKMRIILQILLSSHG